MRLLPLSVVSLIVSLVPAALSLSHSAPPSPSDQAESFFKDAQKDGHTNNWAVLVCSSRYWFNYRHMANTLGMYRTVKRLGIPDSQIILMLADDVACSPRNAFPATVYANSGRQLDLYGSSGEGVEVDYRGYEVNVESFLRVLTGRTRSDLPPSKQLLSDSSSNVFLYMTGHGGNEFLKFQDNEEVSAYDLGDAIGQMWEKRRYNKMLFIIDTCQANTMYSQIYSPNVIASGSSGLGENSYSHHNDADIGVAVIDGFTHYILQYLEEVEIGSQRTMQEFFDMYDPHLIKSHPGLRTDLFPYNLSTTLITDFFGSVSQVEVSPAVPVAASSSSSGASERAVQRREGGKAGQSSNVVEADERSFSLQDEKKTSVGWLAGLGVLAMAGGAWFIGSV